VLQQQLCLRPGGQALRVYSQDARGTFSRQAARRRTLKETMMAPSEGTAISAGTLRSMLRKRIRRIHMFLGLPDPLVRDTDERRFASWV
jgi:hypothetical protein